MAKRKLLVNKLSWQSHKLPFRPIEPFKFREVDREKGIFGLEKKTHQPCQILKTSPPPSRSPFYPHSRPSAVPNRPARAGRQHGDTDIDHCLFTAQAEAGGGACEQSEQSSGDYYFLDTPIPAPALQVMAARHTGTTDGRLHTAITDHSPMGPTFGPRWRLWPEQKIGVQLSPGVGNYFGGSQIRVCGPVYRGAACWIGCECDIHCCRRKGEE